MNNAHDLAESYAAQIIQVQSADSVPVALSAADVIFSGIQRDRHGNGFALFSDAVTGTTFSVMAGENVGDALVRVRARFQEGPQ